jgi:hypothetical protein
MSGFPGKKFDSIGSEKMLINDFMAANCTSANPKSSQLAEVMTRVLETSPSLFQAAKEFTWTCKTITESPKSERLNWYNHCAIKHCNGLLG